MSKTPPFARIAITLPAPDLAAADRLATRYDRSRSWIIAEAVRRFVRADDDAAASVVPPASQLPRGLGPSRLAQLRKDLALTPELRVREAEDTLRLSARHQSARRHLLMTFDRYEDFLDWKHQRDAR